jgi:hypothetical protein
MQQHSSCGAGKSQGAPQAAVSCAFHPHNMLGNTPATKKVNDRACHTAATCCNSSCGVCRLQGICCSDSFQMLQGICQCVCVLYWLSRLGPGVGGAAAGVAGLVSPLYGSDQNWPAAEQCTCGEDDDVASPGSAAACEGRGRAYARNRAGTPIALE